MHSKKQQQTPSSRLYGFSQTSSERTLSRDQNKDPNIQQINPLEKKRKYGKISDALQNNHGKQQDSMSSVNGVGKTTKVNPSVGSGCVALATNPNNNASSRTGHSRLTVTTPHSHSMSNLMSNAGSTRKVPPNGTVVGAANPAKKPVLNNRVSSSYNLYSRKPPANDLSQRKSKEIVPIADLDLALGNLRKGLSDLEFLLNNLQNSFKTPRESSIDAIQHSKSIPSIDPYQFKEFLSAEDTLRKILLQHQELRQRHNLENQSLENRLLLLKNQYESTQVITQSEQSEQFQLLTKINQAEIELQSLDQELILTQTKFQNELDQLTEQFEQEISQTKQQLRDQLQVLLDDVQMTQTQLHQQENQIEHLETDLSNHKNRILYFETKIRDDETLRKQLHETIQELKGNIRVICRIRPSIEAETMDDVQYNIPDQAGQELLVEVTGMKDITGRRIETKQTHPWKFDRVFGPHSGQKEVFEEISHLVQSSLDGYNCCIFAYGQTGSGKTYTMEGAEDLDNEETRGMIYRSVQQVFDASHRLKLQGWNYEMKASFFEIYLENIRDLLSNDQKNLEPKLDPSNGKVFIPDLKTVKVNGPSRLFELLKKAARNRATESTKKNKRSSRSHSIFQLHIEGYNSITKESIQGLLNFIDLAGSEKLETSGVNIDKAKVTIFINTSLSALKDVFAALAINAKHVPYRHSRLTYVLQNSLSGNSKTMMFVNVSPATENLNESLNSLRFATNVNSCNLGSAKKSSKITFN